MTSARTFVTILLAFCATVVGAVTTVPPGLAEHTDRRTGQQTSPTAATSQRVPAVTPPPSVEPRPPVLLVRGDEGKPSAPLVLERARYEVTVTGLAVRTRATLVFRNDLRRVLEGELVFPLPEGALVSGFGLDVAGRIVDGVVVEAQQARVAFETEVRKGVDPGLVEWVRGNNFRTRVWPIPANGRRTVTLEYLTDLAVHESGASREAIYELPLRFSTPVEELGLKIEVVRGTTTPTVRSGLANFSFNRWQDRFVAETTRKGVKPGDDLRVVLPDVPREAVTVETNDRGETFFAIDDLPSLSTKIAAVAAPRRIGIVWDASFSRKDADRERDLRLLAAHLAGLGDIEAQIVIVRNTSTAPRRIAVRRGDAAALVAELRQEPCDGATDLASLRFPDDVDYNLFFSDGLSTVGGRARGWPARPTYVLSGDPRSDHGRLRVIAERSGGAYFNLQRHTDEEVLGRLGRPVFSLLGVDADPTTVADLEPSGAQPVSSRVRVSGRLLAPEARISLRYGVPGRQPSEVRAVVVRRQPGQTTGLVDRLWAQQRMAALAVDAEANRADLVTLGQRFSLVTPGTSLLVLETLEQYVEHNVTPPATLPEMRTAFLQRRDAETSRKITRRTDKTARVVAMWERRVQWWSREFAYQPGFKYVDPAGGQALGQSERREAIDRPAGAARPVASPAPPPMTVPASTPGLAAEAAAAGGALPLGSGDRDSSAPRIVVKPWNPDTPYLRSLDRAGAANAYRVYLAERDTYGESPAFYLDCADFFFRHSQRDLALRVLTNVAELRLDDARLLRVLAHRLEQVDELDLAVELFDHVRRLRPEEPQSSRDLALVLDKRAGARQPGASKLSPASMEDYRRALSLLAEVVEGQWDDRFPEIEVIALTEANRIATLVERGSGESVWPMDARLRRLLDADVRIVLTWDTDQTDMDLWVIEPSGEKCFFSHALTTIGGAISKDFTGGYGPEEYAVRRAIDGEYTVKANFYGSRSQSLTGPTTVQATVTTDYGRPTEQRRAITIRLTTARDVVDVGSVGFKKSAGSK